MENLYNYIFWYNSYQSLWYAIPSDKQLQFFNGNKSNVEGILSSSEITELINTVKQEN
jgi:hypothetical protein